MKNGTMPHKGNPPPDVHPGRGFGCTGVRVLAGVRGRGAGPAYSWPVRAGQRRPEGPYREPYQLRVGASDVLATEPHSRIDVFDVAGNKIISYSSDELNAGDLNPLGRPRRWNALGPRTAH